MTDTLKPSPPSIVKVDDKPMAAQTAKKLDCRALFSPEAWAFMMTARQVIIMLLGSLEDYMGIERSVTPRRKRDRDRDGS